MERLFNKLSKSRRDMSEEEREAEGASNFFKPLLEKLTSPLKREIKVSEMIEGKYYKFYGFELTGEGGHTDGDPYIGLSTDDEKDFIEQLGKLIKLRGSKVKLTGIVKPDDDSMGYYVKTDNHGINEFLDRIDMGLSDPTKEYPSGIRMKLVYVKSWNESTKPVKKSRKPKKTEKI